MASDSKPVLSQYPISSSDYNALPHVSDAHETTQTNHTEEARESLLRLIADHGLSDVFSIHLLHKHFDVPEAHIMVYETIRGSSHPTYQVMAARKPESLPATHGKYFFAAPDGTMRAYEYSTDPQPDAAQYSGFCSMVWQEIHNLGKQNVFALGVRPYSPLENYTEIELPFANATVFVEDLELASSIDTDWVNPSQRWDGGLPLVQAKTRGGRCTYSKARHTSIGPESLDKDKYGNDVLYLGGTVLPAGCGAFNVLTRAMKHVSVM